MIRRIPGNNTWLTPYIYLLLPFQEIRGNIRVHCRIRPLIASIDSNDPATLGKPGTPSEEVVKYVDEETLSYVSIKSNGERLMSQKEFEHVYNLKDNQAAVFSDVKPLLTSLLDG